MMMKIIAGMKHGVLHQKLLLIQITPLYLKRWKNGLNKFLENCFQDIFKSFMKLTEDLLEEVKEKYSKDQNVLDKLTIISAGKDKRVRMANLAIVGSFAVNGVAALHTEYFKEKNFS
ncbi:MAG: glycogen/starch/alpha-glucan phosphorylase [Ignavibacteriales bacterium]|nr:glycogen/starch/alpha-glucan phosphorylase [Ignavibacteriales bacterium]